MRFSSLSAVLVVAATAALAFPANAQTPAAAPTLTLEEAITLARRNNPEFLRTSNTLRTADAQVRSSYGSLLPSSTASFSARHQRAGQQFFQGVALQSSGDQRQANYNVGLTYSVNAQSLISPRAARATRSAVEADIGGASEALRAQVTQQYINTLQAEARAILQDTLALTAMAQLELARARMAVGAGTALDVRRAEVAVGQAEVASLTAHNTAAIEKLRLYQQLGIPAEESVRLTTTFTVSQPDFHVDTLVAMAQRVNPALNALRSRAHASRMNLRMQQSRYTPTLTVGTGWSGNAFMYADPEFPVQQRDNQLRNLRASCFFEDSVRAGAGMPARSQPCGTLVMTPEIEQSIRDDNRLRFQDAPRSIFAQLSIPVFDGFSRELAVEQAQVERQNSDLQLRARELQTRTEVTGAYLNVVTAARTVELQEQNGLRAREELAFAEERYRVGAATFLDVITSRGTFEQAQIDRLNAVYEYHKAFATLESAVGRPLR